MTVYLGSDKIGNSIFKNNAKMGKIVEGSLEELIAEDFDGVYSIPEYKFAYSPGLKKVTFGEEVYKISNDAFTECDSLEEISQFNGSIIGNSAFYYCPKLKNVELLYPNTEFGNYVFSGCALDNNTVETITNKGYSFGKSCFMNCHNITKLNLKFSNMPDTVNRNVLENNTSYWIQGIEIPEGFFMGCINLEEVTLGPRIVTINNAVFANCPKLKKLTIMAEFPPSTGSTGFVDNVYNHPLEVIYIPKGTMNRYINSYPFWNNFSDKFVEME